MTAQDFFKKAANYLMEESPFVIYKKPVLAEDKTVKINGFFQENNELYKVEDYEETGFVFAPFQLNKGAVFIPLEKAEKITVEMNVEEYTEALSTKKASISIEAKNHHLDLVARAVEAIQNGKFQKVVLSRKATIETEKNPLLVFKELVKSYPTAFVYCWYHPKIGLWLGATPETLLSITANRLKTMSVAGTKAVIQNEKKDINANPVWTTKEIEEQQIVTDAITNELNGKVENLQISKTHNYRAGNLWHLKTDISGTLPLKTPGNTLKNIIENLHPTPAICGLPKKKAAQFIFQHENYNREFYAGFLGELNLKVKTTRSSNRKNQENQAYQLVKKESHLFVNLRCMQFKEGLAQLYVGGGIVKDSNPESEWEETQNKSQTILKVL